MQRSSAPVRPDQGLSHSRYAERSMTRDNPSPSPRTRGRRLAGFLSALFFAVLASGCLDGTTTQVEPAPSVDEVEFSPIFEIDLSAMEERPSGLWIRDEVVPEEGTQAGEFDLAVVDYVLWLPNGQEADRGRLEFVPAGGQLIPGFAEGVLGMRAGGRRLLLVPPHLGYGGREWLVFRVDLVAVNPRD